MKYRVKGWKKFQHFKDRKPPWVKLYRDLLDDMEWHELDGASAKALISIWLIASENDGELPEMKRLAFRLRMSEAACISICSNLSHYLEQVDNAPISTRYQDDPLETERETEEETETERDTREQVRADIDINPQSVSKAKKPKAEAVRGTRWHPDYVVPDEWIDAASEARKRAGLSSVDMRHEVVKFSHYWASPDAKNPMKKDWRQTFINWILNSKGAANGYGKSEQKSALTEVFGGLYAEARAAREAGGN